MGDDGGVDDMIAIKVVSWFDSGNILKVEPRGFSGR